MMMTVKTFRIAALAACTILVPVTALAGVGTIVSPKVNKGEFELQTNGTRSDDDSGANHNKQGHTVKVEYGFTDDWKMEVGSKFTDSHSQDFRAQEVFVETVHQLTDQDEGWWLSSALEGEYVRDLTGSPDVLEFKALFQHDTSQFQYRGNVILEREIGKNAAVDVEIGSRAYAMYKYNEYVNPAIEWHADWGSNRDIPALDRQGHYIGPAIYGDLFHTKDGEVGYQLGYLFGATDASNDGVLRWKLAYETAF